jgi:hypothetical protein
MTINYKNIGLFFLVACLILGTGFVQSWNTALFILNMGLVSAIMALGVNLQWGFAGLFNVGIMGFVALGGLADGFDLNAPDNRGLGRRRSACHFRLDPGRRHCDRGNLSTNTDGSRTRQNLNNHRHFDRRLFHLSRGF